MKDITWNDRVKNEVRITLSQRGKEDSTYNKTK